MRHDLPLTRKFLQSASLLRFIAGAFLWVFCSTVSNSQSHFSTYDQHVLFDNAPPGGYYYHSQGTSVVPSRLELVNGKLPVDTGRFATPPNAIRVTFRSAVGGDWRTTINAINRYGHRFEFAGDALRLRVFLNRELAYAASPRIGVQDTNGNSLPDIPLVRGNERLAAGVWHTLVIPFADFVAPFGLTADPSFDRKNLASISLTQGLDADEDHTLWIDDIGTTYLGLQDPMAPSPPSSFCVSSHDQHVDLKWSRSPSSDVLHYLLEKSYDGGEFVPLLTRSPRFERAVDHVGEVRKAATYRLTAIDAQGNTSAPVICRALPTRPYSDDELLSMVQQSCFRYYWEGSQAESGMAAEILPGDPHLVALGASGFGIMATLVAIERGFVSRDEGLARILQNVSFLEKADRFHGAWPHFLDGRTGRIWPFFGRYDNGGDLVETAFLMQGLLTARQYFQRDDLREQELRDRITALWKAVEWDWYRQDPQSDFLYWHWSPDHHWHISHPLIGWNETMIVYLLAIASPTHAVPASMYYSGWAGQSERAIKYRQNWSRTTQGDRYANGNEYYGIKLDVGEGTGGELFFTQFSFLGFDPRGLRDKYTNYFENNRAIARIHHAYCVENPRRHAGYGPACWGRSAGVFSGGGRALPRDDNGTICCSAALGAFPYAPHESLAALKHFYRELGPRAFGAYGFHDGFNQTEGWYDEVYMGLNQAQIVVMIENHRTGLIWNAFMANPEIKEMIKQVGFTRDDVGFPPDAN